MKPIGREVEQIVCVLWEAMFELPLTLDIGGEVEPGTFVTGIVAIDGAWHRAIIARFPRTLASRLTMQLLRSENQPDEADVMDAIGELTNIMAGNVKVFFAGPTTLSLPVVTLGSDYEFDIVGSTVMVSRNFTCGGEVLSVTVVEGGDGNKTLGDPQAFRT